MDYFPDENKQVKFANVLYMYWLIQVYDAD